jgi:hypothetical protein
MSGHQRRPLARAQIKVAGREVTTNANDLREQGAE